MEDNPVLAFLKTAGKGILTILMVASTLAFAITAYNLSQTRFPPNDGESVLAFVLVVASFGVFCVCWWLKRKIRNND